MGKRNLEPGSVALWKSSYTCARSSCFHEAVVMGFCCERVCVCVSVSPWSNCFWMLSWSVLFPLTRYRPSHVRPANTNNPQLQWRLWPTSFKRTFNIKPEPRQREPWKRFHLTWSQTAFSVYRFVFLSSSFLFIWTTCVKAWKEWRCGIIRVFWVPLDQRKHEPHALRSYLT